MFDRFGVWYRLTGDEAEARAKAEDLCLEQSVEYPASLVPEGFIRDHIVGHIERFEPDPNGGAYRVLVSFLNDSVGGELTQLLNVLYGNISLKKGFRLESLREGDSIWNTFKGPRFGRSGLRQILGQPKRPLLATAIKPMGLSSKALADQAYKFACGGIDIIKDDHGLANQPFAAFKERTERCVEAVRKGSQKCGRPVLFAPNITASYDDLMIRASFAKEQGAGALLVAPGLTGFDAMRTLADDESIGLPILSHPAFVGSFVTSPDNGISPYALFGQIMRLAGADASIYPHFGGRFGFSLDECRGIVDGSQSPLGQSKSIFPAPGGGMKLQRIPELRAFYGDEVMFLVGGDLVKNGPDIEKNCAMFREMVEK
jgi:ribulose-bisphosphate carboxylase large chain